MSDERKLGELQEQMEEEPSYIVEEEDDEPVGGIWRRVRRVLITLLILFLFAAGTGIGVGAYVLNSLQPTDPGEEIRFMIEPGTHSSTIAEALESQGLIHDAFIFKLYLRYKSEGNRFQAGEYAIRPGTELDAIIDKFNRGDTVKEPMLRFTIPEGRTFAQITDALSQSGVVDRLVFLELTSDSSRFSDTLVAEIPEDRPYKNRLEGYIFPETYEMPESSTDEEIVTRMFEELERKLETLPADWQDRMGELGLTFHDILTVASLIEREVVVDEERAVVAGVIYNRLNQKYPLQIDATVQYALEAPKERLLYEDLEVDSPYNTYKHTGLPPGPIASPGLKSIEAALYPETTNYMFYVTKKDGTAEHYFAETYEAHQSNIAKSDQNAKQVNTEKTQ